MRLILTIILIHLAVQAFAELVPCTHKNDTEVTITSGAHKGKKGTITLREQYLGEMHHRIEITETVNVLEEDLEAGVPQEETPADRLKRITDKEKTH